MLSPRSRINLSIRRGFFLVSACPYQYANGRSAFDANAIGAVVAAVPKGLAGDAVGIGP